MGEPWLLPHPTPFVGWLLSIILGRAASPSLIKGGVWVLQSSHHLSLEPVSSGWHIHYKDPDSISWRRGKFHKCWNRAAGVSLCLCLPPSLLNSFQFEKKKIDKSIKNLCRRENHDPGGVITPFPSPFHAWQVSLFRLSLYCPHSYLGAQVFSKWAFIDLFPELCLSWVPSGDASRLFFCGSSFQGSLCQVGTFRGMGFIRALTFDLGWGAWLSLNVFTQFFSTHGGYWFLLFFFSFF